jgi:hypothetical protein
MKTMKRNILTLVALLAMTAGAWAEEVTVTFTQADLKGLSTVAKDGVTLTPGKNGVHNDENLYDYGSTTFSVDKGTFTKIEIVDCTYGAISGWQKIQTGSYRPYPEDQPERWDPLYTLTWTGKAESVTFTASVYSIQSIVFTIDKPDVEVNTNKAEGETTFTQATFDMPSYDATVSYELVRDLAYKVTAMLSSSRIRITKDASDKFVTAVDDALALTVSDVISGSAVAMSAYDATTNVDGDYTATLQKQGDTENDWSDVSELSVGTFRYLVTGKNNYDGTINTATFELFQGYEVTVPAGEYITYYKDENLRLDEADKASIELYTITGVSGTTATLSQPVDAMKESTPMLVHNKGTEDKTFFLIPCNEPDLIVRAAEEFQGTLTGTTIAASTGAQNNYAFNGKQFVIVRSNLEIGANKCWLSVEATSGARAINLVFDDATRIDGVIRAIDLNGDYYDLNGRKLQGIPTRKGIYIKNGKKVVVK